MAVMVVHRDQVQHVKIVAELKQNNRTEHVTHTRVYRPWGSYEGIDLGERFQVKRITVNPGGKLSLQMHHHRAEHWVVVGRRQWLLAAMKRNCWLKTNRCIYRSAVSIGLETPGKCLCI